MRPHYNALALRIWRGVCAVMLRVTEGPQGWSVVLDGEAHDEYEDESQRAKQER